MSGHSWETSAAMMPRVAQQDYIHSAKATIPLVPGLLRKWAAYQQYGRSARRHHRAQSVLSGDFGLHPGPGSHRNRQHRYEQFRRRPGDGRRRLGQRPGEERHQPTARIGVRSHHRLPLEGQEFLPAATRSERDRSLLFTAARSEGLSRRTSCSTLAPWKGRGSGPMRETRCRISARTVWSACPPRRCAPAISPPPARFSTTRHLNFVERYRTHCVPERHDPGEPHQPYFHRDPGGPAVAQPAGLHQ